MSAFSLVKFTHCFRFRRSDRQLVDTESQQHCRPCQPRASLVHCCTYHTQLSYLQSPGEQTSESDEMQQRQRRDLSE